MTEEPQSPAQAYHDYYGPSIFEPLLEHVIELAAPQPGERVLDVACGTGIVTRAVAERVGGAGGAVGVDLNPAMVEVARSLPAPAGTIEWREGDGTALDLPDASFDLVVCQQGLQFFPDRAAGATEMRRVLADGGRAVVAVWRGLDVHPLFAALADAAEPHLDALGIEVPPGARVAPFSLGDADELRDILTAAAGFRDVEIVSRTVRASFVDPDHFVERMEYAYAAVIPEFAENPDTFRTYAEAIAADTEAVVETYREGDRVVVPMHANIAVARV